MNNLPHITVSDNRRFLQTESGAPFSGWATPPGSFFIA